MWARENKITFNEQKSKMMITRRRPKIKRDYKTYQNNTTMRQEETIKYLGVIIDKRLNFNRHRLHDREMHQANSRPVNVGEGQLGTMT